MKDDIPDYSSYSLDDLHDVARRVNRQLYPDRYALIVQELERRELPLSNLASPVVARVPGVLETEGWLLPLLRFVGGFAPLAVTGLGLFIGPLLRDDSQFLWISFIGLILLLVIAPGVGLYSGFLHRGKPYVPGKPITYGIICDFILQALLTVAGGAFLARGITFGLGIFLLPPSATDLIAGMSNYETTELLMNAFTVLGAIGALWLWWWRRGRIGRRP